ncbi:MAG: hypothetical protein LBC45_02380 [Chlamydiales bacterium]|jgi:hypothetical protein|nr:hypothetical protein [Chlamydiales bacterium]
MKGLFISVVFALALCFSLDLCSASSIRIVPVSTTPEPDHVHVKVIYPSEEELCRSDSRGQIRITGLALGVDSEFPRKKEIFNDPKGQTLHMVIDNQPYFTITESDMDVRRGIDGNNDELILFDIPFALHPGMHVMRVFPARSFKESLKDEGCFAVRTFYHQSHEQHFFVDLCKPYLTYNEPQGTYFQQGCNQQDCNPQPILLDFYITNCQLSRDGYKVAVEIDHTTKEILTSWQPYYIYGLKRGTHRIRLQLLDSNNQLVPGIFNHVERRFNIQ